MQLEQKAKRLEDILALKNAVFQCPRNSRDTYIVTTQPLGSILEAKPPHQGQKTRTRAGGLQATPPTPQFWRAISQPQHVIFFT